MLTDEQVRELRASDLPGTYWAERLGLSAAYVSLIRMGRRRKAAGGRIRPARQAVKLSADQVRRIRKSREGSRRVAERYGISQGHVVNLRARRKRFRKQTRKILLAQDHECPKGGAVENLGAFACLGFCSCGQHLELHKGAMACPRCDLGRAA